MDRLSAPNLGAAHLSHPVRQFGNRDAERAGYRVDVAKGQVTLAPFDAADVGPVQSALVRERFLRKTESIPLLTQPVADSSRRKKLVSKSPYLAALQRR